MENKITSDSNYHPQTKLRKGNVFTSVCQKFCAYGGGVYPRADPPGRHPPPRRWLLQRTVRILLECIPVND